MHYVPACPVMAEATLSILLVEDNPDDAELILREIKRSNGFTIRSQVVQTEDEFKRALNQQIWQIVICDYSLPNFSGPRAIEIIEGYNLLTRVILISGVITEEHARRVLGRRSMISFLSKNHMGDIGPLIRHEVRLLEQYEPLIESYPRFLQIRDKETAAHTQRVTELTIRLARAMGVSEMDIVHIRRGALLHDIGKIGVPDHILLKQGKLTDEEQDVMRQHPNIAHDFLMPIQYLRYSLDIPYCHHEAWDGSGYPRGLKGEEIPLAARIFAVVDNFDALTSDRPYRKAFTQGFTLTYIAEQSGKLFDPRVVMFFLEMMS